MHPRSHKPQHKSTFKAFNAVHAQDLEEVQLAPAAKRRRTVASRRPADVSTSEQPDLRGTLSTSPAPGHLQSPLSQAPLLPLCHAGQLISTLQEFLSCHESSAQLDQHSEEDGALPEQPGPTLQELTGLSDVVGRLDGHVLEKSAATLLLQVISVLAPLVTNGHRLLIHANDRVRLPTRMSSLASVLQASLMLVSQLKALSHSQEHAASFAC